MKTSQPLPVEVLRIEDKITTFLSLKQFICLLSAGAAAAALFFLLPPGGHLVFYKAYWLSLILLMGLLLIIRVSAALNSRMVNHNCWLQFKA